MIKNAKVIILNGTSSSGKSTLARELQACSDDVYLVLSLDDFWNMTPLNILANSINFPNMKLAMAKSVKALVDTGHNVIVDIVFCGYKTYLEFSSELAGINHIFVKVTCSIEELKKRELSRGDRKIGLAESQLAAIHNNVAYDLEIDTSEHSPSECAKTIIDNFRSQTHKKNLTINNL